MQSPETRSPKAPSPPPRAFRLRTDDLDEYRSWADAAQNPHGRVVHGSGPLGADLSVLRFGTGGLASCRMGLPQRLRGTVSRLCLHVAVAGANRYKVGRRVLEVAPGTAVLVPARLEFTRDAQPGTLVAVECDDAALQSEARKCSDSDTTKFKTTLHPLDLRQPAAAALRAALGKLQEAASAPSAHVLAEAGAAMMSAIAAAACTDDPATKTAAPGSRRLARLEEWIDTHLDEPITMGRLCDVAGVGARALQKAFVARRHMSPMQFITERRLAAALRKLARAHDEESVSQIALSVGLSHLGRFSQLYKQAYGEPPSRTLQRRLALR